MRVSAAIVCTGLLGLSCQTTALACSAETRAQLQDWAYDAADEIFVGEFRGVRTSNILDWAKVRISDFLASPGPDLGSRYMRKADWYQIAKFDRIHTSKGDQSSGISEISFGPTKECENSMDFEDGDRVLVFAFRTEGGRLEGWLPFSEIAETIKDPLIQEMAQRGELAGIELSETRQPAPSR